MEPVSFPAKLTKSGDRYYIHVPKMYLEHGWLDTETSYTITITIKTEEPKPTSKD